MDDKDVQQRREHLHRVLLHSTFVVSTEGLPLGLLLEQFSAPKPKSEMDTRPAASIPIEEKKTHLLD